MPSIKMKYFNELIDIKPFFDQLAKSKQEKYEKLYYNYATGNSSDYSYRQNYFKHTDIDLWGQTIMTITQQINFKEKLEENIAKMLFNVILNIF